VRSDEKAGTIKIEASSDGLKSSAVVVETK